MFEVLYEYFISIVAYILSWFGYDLKAHLDGFVDKDATVELVPPTILPSPVELPATEVIA